MSTTTLNVTVTNGDGEVLDSFEVEDVPVVDGDGAQAKLAIVGLASSIRAGIA